MSYICEKCGEVIGPNVPQLKKVVETRPRVKTVQNETVEDGFEIVREVKVCPSCYGL